jgi:hypothetical protein
VLCGYSIILCVFRPLQRRFLLCWLGFSHEIDMPIYTSLPRSAIIFLYYLGVKASIRIVLAIDMTGHKSNLVLLPRTLDSVSVHCHGERIILSSKLLIYYPPSWLSEG